MSEFKKKTFGNNRRPSSGGFSRPSYGGGRPGARDFAASPERHQATCNKCGTTCEVPFRPNGKKPVYCRDCFVKEDDRGERPAYPKREFGGERPAFRPQPSNDRAIEALSRQITTLEAKVDALSAKIDVLMPGAKDSSVPNREVPIKKASVLKKKRTPTKR